MGEIIRKSASVEEIMADARHALVGATTKGGVWKAAADQSLTPAVTLFDTVETKRVALENTVVPLVAALNHQDEVADAAIGRMSDSVWNDVGRPAPGADPSYELLFPSGISFYTDGPDDEPQEPRDHDLPQEHAGPVGELDLLDLGRTAHFPVLRKFNGTPTRVEPR